MKNKVSNNLRLTTYVILLGYVGIIILLPSYQDIYGSKLLLIQSHLFSSIVLLIVFTYNLVRYIIEVVRRGKPESDYLKNNRLSKYGILLILLLIVLQLYLFNGNQKVTHFFLESYVSYNPLYTDYSDLLNGINYGTSFYSLIILSILWIIYIVFECLLVYLKTNNSNIIKN